MILFAFDIHRSGCICAQNRWLKSLLFSFCITANVPWQRQRHMYPQGGKCIFTGSEHASKHSNSAQQMGLTHCRTFCSNHLANITYSLNCRKKSIETQAIVCLEVSPFCCFHSSIMDGLWMGTLQWLAFRVPILWMSDKGCLNPSACVQAWFL